MTVVIPLLACALGALLSILLALTPARRLPAPALGWLIAPAPALAFAALLALSPQVLAGETLTWRLAWMPTLGLNATLTLDGLSLLFGLLVSGIGALVTIYAGYYFSGHEGSSEARFFVFLTLFMTAMLGLVLAGDVITLFVFWEGTSLTSFLLVGYKFKDEAARQAAFRALFITGGGGIALLAGLVLLMVLSGSAEFNAILAQGTQLRAHWLYPVVVGLIALGAFTKSAQFPAHFWLPGAMSAPTPASAYLHSATMVKAGVYLLARLNPALGYTDLWFWLLSVVGLTTMLVGAYIGFKQNDLKALLAYSTVSQLGALIAMIGQDTEIAFKALTVSLTAHALYKSALFLVTGIVDHETGTRDLQQLGGLWRAMPFTFAVAGLAALSMAGLPPLFGFLAKETQLATITHPSVPPAASAIFTAIVVVAGALVLAQAGLIVLDGFLGAPRRKHHAHEAPAPMWMAPALPALGSLVIGLLPEPEWLATLLASAASAASGAKVKVSLALWTGINIPLVLSAIAVLAGSTLLWTRQRVRPQLAQATGNWQLEPIYRAVLRGIDGLAWLTTRVQNGQLRLYLAVMLVSLIVMVVGVGRLPLPALALPSLALNAGALLRLVLLALTTGAALASVLLRRDLFAILALAASGLSIAGLMLLEPAPDIALVQVVVEVLTAVVLVLVLTRLPASQRARAAEFTFRQSRFGLLRDALLALGTSAVVFVLVFNALSTRPRTSQLTPFFEQNAKPLTSANDIVGAIIIDFRGLDTLIEIAVFSAAGMAIYVLLRYASRKAGDREDEPAPRYALQRLCGVGGMCLSPMLRVLARFMLPLTMVLGVSHILLGHDQPGDGFTAGVIIALGVASWYVVYGYAETKRRLTWLNASVLIGVGLGIAVINGLIATWVNGAFLSPVDFGRWLGISAFLPKGVYLSTATLYELAICLTVLGSAVLMLDTLGRPRDADTETEAQLAAIAQLRASGAVTLPEEPQAQQQENKER